jgi:hypothetical protein
VQELYERGGRRLRIEEYHCMKGFGGEFNLENDSDLQSRQGLYER